MALRWKAYAPNTVLKAVEVQDLADNGVIQVDTAADLADANLVNANVTYVTGESKPYVRIAAGVGADKWKAFSGGLAGLGGWAEISAVTGSPKRHDYTDAGGTEWSAFEWTGDGSVTTTAGLADTLVVGGGGNASSNAAGAGGYVNKGLLMMPAATTNTIVGGANGGKPSSIDGLVTVNGSGHSLWNGAAGLPDRHTGITYGITGTDLMYGAGGENPARVNPGGGGATSSGAAGQPGVVIIRVPKDKVTATTGWV